MIVAIDGPAGSGKSTTARAVAARSGLLYLDTGAMYRAVALRFNELGLEANPENAEEVFKSFSLEIKHAENELLVWLNGRDINEEIRSRDVTEMSSRVSALALVRERMVAEQRRAARAEEERGRGVVVEGRDIGTVVFPNADLKIYLDASPEVRARRRVAELRACSVDVDEEAIAADMHRRDERDRTRAISPLLKAEDAITLDTTYLTLEELVDQVVAIIRERQ